MLRSMFRVLVVASVVLSLTVVTVPSVQAGQSNAKAPVVKVDTGWLQAAIAWLNQLIKGPTPKPAPKGPRSTAAGQRSATYGSCIDPWGNPRPCP